MICSPIKLRRSARVAGQAVASLQVDAKHEATTTRAAKQRPGRVAAGKRQPSPDTDVVTKPGFPSRDLERNCWAKGFKHIAGVDEAGRGPLAGPVVAGACVMPAHIDIVGIRDSKLMTAEQREQVFELLMAHPEIICATCVIDVKDIDELNILQAALKAMEGAISALQTQTPDFILVDGTQIPKGFQKQMCQTVVKGDTKSTVIAAASILAKVTRDRLMMQYHEQWPQYNFAQHKGYGTAAHMAALRMHGPCPIHRRSFAPLRNWLLLGEDSAQTDGGASVDDSFKGKKPQ